MKTIHKFPILLTDEQTITVPAGARIISVAIQRDAICLWGEVESGGNSENRTIRIVGTGHEFDPAGYRYIGTVLTQPYGLNVWHIYEKNSV